MPIYATPPLPPEVERAVEIFGMNRVRVAILASLAARGGSATTPELVDDLEVVPSNTISRHLRHLEDAGAVHADLARSLRVGGAGARVTWTLDAERIQGELQTVQARTLPRN